MSQNSVKQYALDLRGDELPLFGSLPIGGGDGVRSSWKFLILVNYNEYLTTILDEGEIPAGDAHSSLSSADN